MKLNYAILFVADMDRSVKFYRDILGLPMKFSTPEWTEFSTGEATLALHRANQSQVENAGFDKSAPGQCRPGLVLDDLDIFHSRVVEHGVTCVQAPREVFGARIAQYLDPDGIVVSVSEAISGA